MNVTKPRPNLSIRTTINVNLSANQWKLDTDSFPRIIIDQVANFLNKKITQAYNHGNKRPVVEENFYYLANHFKMYGATGRDTQEVLNDLLDELFNHQNFIDSQIKKVV